MQKIKSLFIRKKEYEAYEEFLLCWTCAEKITQSLLVMIPQHLSGGQIADAIDRAVKTCSAEYHVELTDWERLALYVLEMLDFIAMHIPVKLQDLENIFPEHLTPEFLYSTAKKISMNTNLIQEELHA